MANNLNSLLNNQINIKLDIWTQIDNYFSEPVTLNSNSSDYVPTQILAVLFKSEGFDAVVYKISLSEGFNLVLFDTNAANLIITSYHCCPVNSRRKAA